VLDVVDGRRPYMTQMSGAVLRTAQKRLLWFQEPIAKLFLDFSRRYWSMKESYATSEGTWARTRPSLPLRRSHWFATTRLRASAAYRRS